MKQHFNKALVFSPLVLFLLAWPVAGHSQHVNPKCCNYPAKQGGIKILFFLEACSVPGETERGMVPYFDCQSYVLGTIDTYRKLNKFTPKKDQICIPESITTRDVLELIWNKYPNWDAPEEKDANDVIIEVLRNEFPCGKSDN